ncbi:MAG: beta-ketoacyl-[acyl-carrier-protein] synthase family protein [Bacteroidales bacterium]|nr:MAG: beta-ketoacyl-[acyl-carrier-protein] synthase family protein [Bacteroidales bacterium]
MNRKVVVTGINIISSLGLDIVTNWENAVRGISGVKRISLFDPGGLQTQIAAEVPSEFEYLVNQNIRKRSARQMTRVTQMCFVCAREAVEKSQIDFERFDKTRCAVIVGVVNTGNSSVEKGTTIQNAILKSMNNSMSAWISMEYRLMGPNYTVATACASSAYAIGFGYDLISSDRADIVIVGGADSIINPEEIRGFNELYALSVSNDPPEKASRPFSINRDGFVIGEGAGILVLESEKSALARNARIYAEVLGYALTSEAFNIMAPMKEGIGMASTMELALKNTKLKPEDIQYINAHGTSTILNDRYETLAIKKVFQDHAYRIPVTSLKSMIGHTIGAAGVIEAAITILSIINKKVTPTINYQKDPELDLDFVPDKAKEHEITHALSNSFAFGGHNASIVLKRYSG